MSHPQASAMVLMVCFLPGCQQGPIETETETESGVSFARDVFPIVARHGCSASQCHDYPASPTAHFTDYRTAESTYKQWTSGFGNDHCPREMGGPSIPAPPPEPRVIPGEPEAGLLIRKLTETRPSCSSFFGRMPPPPQAALSEEEIDTIRFWIQEGAKDN